jgi:molybdopterin synthase catalytic subunit
MGDVKEDDLIALRSTPLEIGSLIDSGGGGAVAVFLGITRGETDAAGRSLVALDYEAYADMALEQMNRLASASRMRWPILRLALLHRTGIVEVGQPSVVVSVSTPHRAEAFEACRFLIDRVKSEAAIWKKEIWSDGSTSWVDGHVARR